MLKEVPKNNKLESLDPDFKTVVERYLRDLNKKFPQYKIYVGEARRTVERQKYLFSQNTKDNWVTNCDGVKNISMHQYGIAVDLVIVHKDNPKVAIWDSRVWRTVLSALSLEDYGLEGLKLEQVHLQKLGSQAAVVNGKLSPAYVSKHKLIKT